MLELSGRAENSSSQILTWASIDPPISNNRTGGITALWAHLDIEHAAIMRCGANGIVDINSSSTPVRANLRRRRSAILMSDTQFHGVIKIVVLPLIPDFFAFFSCPYPCRRGHLDLLYPHYPYRRLRLPRLPWHKLSASSLALASMALFKRPTIRFA